VGEMGLHELIAMAALTLSSGQSETSKQPRIDYTFSENIQDNQTDIETMREAVRLHESGCLLTKLRRDEAQQHWAKAEQLLLDLNKKKPDVKIDVILADIYMNRDKKEKGIEPSDFEKAIPLWENVLKYNEKTNILMEKKIKAQQSLVKCYVEVGSQKFLEAQVLTQFKKTQEAARLIKETYNVETDEQAQELSKQRLRRAVELFDKSVEKKRDYKIAGILTLQYVDSDAELNWSRRMVAVAPDVMFGYRTLITHYQKRGKFGHVLDELDELKEVPENVKRLKIIDAAIDALDAGRKVGQKPSSTNDPVENLKRALLLYETSTARWSREMKKEKITDREPIAAMEEAFIAGTLDYEYSKADERRAAALSRLEKAYNSINEGMDNGLGKLDKAYEHFISRNKIKIEGSDKVTEALKTRLTDKKDF